MTRRDLEETIMNLEYLLGLNRSDAKTREEHEQMLQAFRIVLQAANHQRALITSRPKHKLDWDVKLALMYADEKLSLAAQALNSREHLSVAHRHVRHLLQHQLSLPLRVATCVRSLEETCSRREATGLTDAAGTDALTTATIAVLDTVRDELGKRIQTLAA